MNAGEVPEAIINLWLAACRAQFDAREAPTPKRWRFAAASWTQLADACTEFPTDQSVYRQLAKTAKKNARRV